MTKPDHFKERWYCEKLEEQCAEGELGPRFKEPLPRCLWKMDGSPCEPMGCRYAVKLIDCGHLRIRIHGDDLAESKIKFGDCDQCDFVMNCSFDSYEDYKKWLDEQDDDAAIVL